MTRDHSGMMAQEQAAARAADPSGGPSRRVMKSAAVVVLGLAVALAGCAQSDRGPPTGEPSFYQNLTKGGTLDPAAAQSMISGYRQNNGLTPVTIDPELMRFAEQQSQAMARRDKLDHNVSGPFLTRIKASGYPSKAAAENISAGYHTLAEAFSGWRDSPPHRANMLLKDATRMGIAAVYTPKSKYKVYWTLVLADPLER